MVVYFGELDAGRREKAKLAVKTFALVVGGVLFLQGTLYLVKAEPAEAQLAELDKPNIDYTRFKRPTAPPIPDDEIRHVLTGEGLRGGLD